MSSFTWTKGPIRWSIPDFQVLRVEPGSGSKDWLYVSRGAWEVDTESDVRFEFFILSRIESPEHVESLAMIANFHADKDFHLYCGKVLSIGRPWMLGSHCDHFLLSKPYPFGPSFENLSVSPTLVVRFNWLLPITSDEAEFARTHGADALEQVFEEQGIDYLDVLRESALT